MMFLQSQCLFVESDAAFQVGDVYIKMVEFAFYFHCCYFFRFIVSVYLIFAFRISPMYVRGIPSIGACDGTFLHSRMTEGSVCPLG